VPPLVELPPDGVTPPLPLPPDEFPPDPPVEPPAPPEEPPSPPELHAAEIIPKATAIARAADWSFIASLLPSTRSTGQTVIF
jgi:hypothetical protein